LIFFFRKSVEKIQFSFKSDKNNGQGYFMCGPVDSCDPSSSILRWIGRKCFS